MHKRLRTVALVALIIVLAGACSKPKEQTSQTGGSKKGASALTDSGAKAAGPDKSKGGTKSYSVTGPAAKGYAALNPGADVAQAKRVGQLIRLQSTSYGNPNTWLGVTKDTIKLNFAIDKENCPPNTFALLSQAAANAAKETRFYRKASFDQETINKEINEAIKNTVDYWNIHVADVAADIPQAVQVMKNYNKPGHLFYGRRLTYDVIDAGSFQCPAKQSSAADQMKNQTKPFSAVVYDVPGLYENGIGLAKAMKVKIPAKQRPMLFGMLDTSDKFLTDFAPYVWGEFQSITKQSKLGAGWICSDLKGTGAGAKLWGNGYAVNSPDPAFKKMKRKFGLLYPDSENGKVAANELKSFLKSGCNITFDSNTEIAFSANPARGADEGNTIAAKFKGNAITPPVTTVIYLIDFLGAFFHIIDFKNQGYKPEFAEIGTGWDTNTVQRLSPDQDMVDKASMFYTQFGVQGFGYGPGDPFWVYHSTHKVAPDGKACDPRTDVGMNHGSNGSAAALYCKAPGAIVAWYYSWLPLIGGLIFAGPNLTPSNVSAGLQAYPLTRYGVDGPTTDPVAVLVGAGPGQYYFITDGSSGKWRAGFVSPPPERVLGFPEFNDCQRHYLAWPDKLAPGWEKNGPNYNAWCGDAKYTRGWNDQGKSVAYTPSTASGQKCTKQNPNDTAPPSNRCETDHYPRWEPVLYR